MQKAIDKFRTEFIPFTRFMVLFIAGMALLGVVLRALAPGTALTAWFNKLGLLNIYEQSPVVVWALVAILFYWIVTKVIQRVWPRNDKERQLATLAAFDTLTLESGEVLTRKNMAVASAFREIYLHLTPVKQKQGDRQMFAPAALSVICWNDDSETLHLFYLGSRRHNIVGNFLSLSLSLPTDKQSALRILTSMAVGAIGGEAAGDLKGMEADIAGAISEKAGEHTADKIAPKKDWKIAGLRLTLLLATTGGTKVCELTTLNHMAGRYDSFADIPPSDKKDTLLLAQFLTQIGIGEISLEQADALNEHHKDSPRLRADSDTLPGLPGELVRVTGKGQLQKTTAGRAQWTRRLGLIGRASLSAAGAVVGSWIILTLLGGQAPLNSGWAPQLALAGILPGNLSRAPQLSADAGMYLISTSGSPLNVRGEPNTGAPILTKLPNRSSVFVCGGAEGWKQVLTSRQRGWVAARFLRPDMTPLTQQQVTMLANRCP
ncbi:MAG: SH3 domain-containing protein [Gammaproteobacteria bacterium]|nr:SH3 domain-containing protein [Gammaproteobacteria bacterium]NNF60614.1 SH3 domain-containing protein [Gammaproteobacteria bacterium]